MVASVNGPPDASASGGPDHTADSQRSIRAPIGEFIFAGTSALVGIYVIVAANFIRIPISSNTLGPRSFPYLVGFIMIAAAASVLVQVFRGNRGQADEGEDIDTSVPTDWTTVLKLVALFAAHAFLIGVIGWPLAAAVLFFGAAWSLGAKKLHWAALVALALAFAIFFLFGTLLGLSLPAGPLLDWMPFL
ncbi:putative tricarboxylic transport membrane protein [Rhodoglobus vestalii]|uniref:Putative tricarboxylic transport membrane protein n=1 Tax=Rhodoglobus vestalii TaxID=193384 RepID=A0A8H2K581_9MICO|nr:tripartite tricarboxylate transporter TctB family protein [Rhodoglobus vestalii]TQO18934.1 putative tricarboxylic transport membrane protein [Rhodoglobus vestalii]